MTKRVLLIAAHSALGRGDTAIVVRTHEALRGTSSSSVIDVRAFSADRGPHGQELGLDPDRRISPATATRVTMPAARGLARGSRQGVSPSPLLFAAFPAVPGGERRCPWLAAF